MRRLHQTSPEDVAAALRRHALTRAQLAARFGLSLRAVDAHLKRFRRRGALVVEGGPGDRTYRLEEPATKGAL